MDVMGLTLTQPTKTHSHALWVGVDTGLGEGQCQVGYGLRANARLGMGTVADNQTQPKSRMNYADCHKCPRPLETV